MQTKGVENHAKQFSLHQCGRKENLNFRSWNIDFSLLHVLSLFPSVSLKNFHTDGIRINYRFVNSFLSLIFVIYFKLHVCKTNSLVYCLFCDREIWNAKVLRLLSCRKRRTQEAEGMSEEDVKFIQCHGRCLPCGLMIIPYY